MKKEKQAYKQYKEVITELVAFSSRPGMYIGKEEMDLIIAFLSGIELSSKFQLRFGGDLVEYIFSKYSKNEKIQELKKNRNYYSLKEQIIQLSLEENKTPIQIFKKEALNLLTFISDEVFDGLYLQSMTDQLKLHLQKNIESKDEPFTTSFRSSPEDYILRYLKEWNGKTLPENQIEILEEIKKENSKRNAIWMKRNEGKIDNKSKIRELSKKLLDELNLTKSKI